MLRVVVSLLIILFCGAPPNAAARPSIRRVYLPLQSATGIPGDTDPARIGGHLEEAHAKSVAAMDAFDRRIAMRARRAMSSVCNGCAPPRRGIEPRLERFEASALTDGEIVGDPAQAPLD
ncbi:hypothetical protein [Methylobacterium sp. Leaf89]|uniref:hypothetical protein n=1 Tax=Methylobacterium sp. Leaf89 TaxID=1736245 RepID=UPI000A5CDA89|nr:hypothetical protein [Methylobacterium sp. Leaf89]